MKNRDRLLSLAGLEWLLALITLFLIEGYMGLSLSISNISIVVVLLHWRSILR